nr:MAG TPA: hypothetical protein [Caudoviricetes sp.]
MSKSLAHIRSLCNENYQLLNKIEPIPIAMGRCP